MEINNLVFFYDDGTVRTEYQECVPVMKDDSKLKRFRVNEKPCYLRITFLDDISDFELFNVYDRMISHHLIEVDRSVADIVKDDLEKSGTMRDSSFEIVVYDFKEAFLCGSEIMEMFAEPGMGGWHCERVAVMLSDEPSKGMKNWIDSREEHAP